MCLLGATAVPDGALSMGKGQSARTGDGACGGGGGLWGVGQCSVSTVCVEHSVQDVDNQGRTRICSQ